MTRSPRNFAFLASAGRAYALVAALALAGCEAGPAEAPDDPGTENPFTPEILPRCQVTSDMLFSGGAGRGGIPALVNPTLVPRSHPDAQYLDDYVRLAEGRDDLPDARVVGMVVDGTPVAIPYNILWWHEIVNVELGGRVLAVTYCPLTGSAIVFDATAAGAGRFGVSGLIFRNNLVMFDVETESLWPQMCEGAAIGSKQGTQLVRVRGFEMLWEAWKARYPETLVVGSDTGFDFNYMLYPYGFYEVDEFLLFATEAPVDPRVPFKERVLGIPGEDGGIALPFSTLESSGTTTIIQLGIDRGTALVLWDAGAGTAAAYLPQTTAGEPVTIRAVADHFVDTETESSWNVEGVAVEGPMTGARLAIYDGAFVAFWFAWSEFNPNTRIWTVE